MKNPKEVAKWVLVAAYVISPIDLDPGLPFTDLAAVGAAAYHTWRNRK